MEIRLALTKDLPEINAIYNQAVRQKYCTAHLEEVDLAYTRRWFSEHSPARYPVFVAVEGDRLMAWLSLGPYRPGRQALASTAEISYYVGTGHRGKGVASSLVKFALDRAPDLGFSHLVAILLDRNHASIGLLEKFQFSRWGCLPGIAMIDGEPCDHLYYGRTL
jgi:phosphinothricin acetyltransferase